MDALRQVQSIVQGIAGNADQTAADAPSFVSRRQRAIVLDPEQAEKRRQARAAASDGATDSGGDENIFPLSSAKDAWEPRKDLLVAPEKGKPLSSSSANELPVDPDMRRAPRRRRRRRAKKKEPVAVEGLWVPGQHPPDNDVEMSDATALSMMEIDVATEDEEAALLEDWAPEEDAVVEERAQLQDTLDAHYLEIEDKKFLLKRLLLLNDMLNGEQLLSLGDAQLVKVRDMAKAGYRATGAALERLPEEHDASDRDARAATAAWDDRQAEIRAECERLSVVKIRHWTHPVPSKVLPAGRRPPDCSVRMWALQQSLQQLEHYQIAYRKLLARLGQMLVYQRARNEMHRGMGLDDLIGAELASLRQRQLEGLRKIAAEVQRRQWQRENPR